MTDFRGLDALSLDQARNTNMKCKLEFTICIHATSARKHNGAASNNAESNNAASNNAESAGLPPARAKQRELRIVTFRPRLQPLARPPPAMEREKRETEGNGVFSFPNH